MSQIQTAKFIEVIFKNSRLLRGRMRYASEVAHLSILQIQTLSFLHHHTNAQMREIAEYFRIELPSATSLLNKLVTLQLVKRHNDPHDRRLVRISLTEEGNKLLEKVMAEKSAHFEQMLSYLTDGEKKELLRLLEKLNKRMEEDHES